MTKLKDAETRVTIGDIITLTRKKCGNCNSYQKRDRKIHCVTLSNMDVIPGLHENIFNVTQSLKKGLRVMSEGKTLIRKKNQPEFALKRKW